MNRNKVCSFSSNNLNRRKKNYKNVTYYFFYNMFCLIFATSYDTLYVFYFEILDRILQTKRKHRHNNPHRGHPNNRRLMVTRIVLNLVLSGISAGEVCSIFFQKKIKVSSCRITPLFLFDREILH